MSGNIIHFCRRCLIVAALLPVGSQFAAGSAAPVVSGSYSVVQNKALGTQVQIRMRIHLMNHGPSDLSVQRMTLWDFSHPDKGGSRACTLALRAHASLDTTQDFIVSRSDYQRWQQGFRPRFVLEMASPRNASGWQAPKSTAVVRLDRISGQEGK
ncbi:MAG: hypothetical protein WAN03_12760 [Candidatus Sulfotelmatobacter sp.]